jgi:bifunctional DNase/RNase
LKTKIKQFLGKIATKDEQKQNAPDDSSAHKDDLETRPFGILIDTAEDFITQKSYKKALDLYKLLESQLAGTGELMKIQFVREKIESLIEMIKGNPRPETMVIIEEEAKAAEERFNTTLIEAERYFSHNLYAEALFLYKKLQKEWAGSNDTRKKGFIDMKINNLLELQENIFTDNREPVEWVNKKPSAKKAKPATKTFGMVISDAENYISQKSYKNALTLYRMLDSQLVGSGDLVKIKFVREKIDALIKMIKEYPRPDALDIIEKEKRAAEERYNTTVTEAERYLSHDLYNEAFDLYRKLQKEWISSNDTQKKSFILTKILSLRKLIDNASEVNAPVEEVKKAPPVKKVEPEQKTFGRAINEAENFISQKSYKNALDLYRKVEKQLVGSGELMKIQLVREKIESLIRMIKENPSADTIEIIEDEARAAEARYYTTMIEAEHYFKHELYAEALYLYKKLQKEWISSNDIEKKSNIMSKIQSLRELQEDIFIENEAPDNAVKNKIITS